MKINKIHLFLFSALSLFIFSGCSGEEPVNTPYRLGAKKYYLVRENEKTFLYEIIGLSVLQLDTTQTFETSLQKIQENDKISSINTLREKDCLVFVTSKLSINELKQQPGVINAMPAYNTIKSAEFLSPVYLTGELTLQMKDGYSVEDVRNVFESDAIIKKMEKHDKCILQLRNWEKIFDIANTLHLHEKVLYCAPNMFGTYSLD